MFKVLFFIVFIINIHNSSCVFEALYEASQKVWKLYTIIDNRETEILRNPNATEHLSVEPIIRELKKQLDDIHESLNQLEEFTGPEGVWEIIKSWTLNASTIKRITEIALFVDTIDRYYTKFNNYSNDGCYSNLSSKLLMEYVFLNIESSILVIRRFAINQGISPLEDGKDIVAAIGDYAIAHSAEICGFSEVIPNIIIKLFRMIIIAELKTSIIFAYRNICEYVQTEDEQAWRRINSLASEEFEKKLPVYINIFSPHIAGIDRIYSRACDPPGGNWTRDESFYELEKTFQAIVFNYNFDNCGFSSCNSILIRKNWRCPPLFSPKPVLRSPGDTIAQCAYLKHIKACVLKSGPYTYQYVDSTELGFLGRNSSCPKDNGQVIESMNTWEATYAACACNFNSSHNKISLLMIESTVAYNQVITGLRFIRKDEVLYIQPRAGILESNGFINQSSQRWIPIPENIDSSPIEPINKNNSVFFLDDLTLPMNYVLTGVGFNKVTRGDVSGFAIEIIGTLFNYRSGKLSLFELPKRLTKGSNEKSGKSLSFNPVSSVFTKLLHKATSSDTKYVSLDRSALKEDFGQSTLPLFDAVPITFEVPSALGGVGMFHKGVENYAGFISLRVYGINYKEYFNAFKESHISHDEVSFKSFFG